jgi:hypothetical protein
MRWGRVEWLLAVAYAAASLGISELLAHERSEVWRYEYARAMDGAALYLFAMAPVLCACTAIAAQRRQTWLDGIRSSLREPHLPGRSAAWRFILWALGVHVVTVIGALRLAKANFAMTVWSPLPLVLPSLVIVMSATVGALLGARVRSPLVPVLVGTLTFAVASSSQLGLRELLMAGGGFFDYGFYTPTLGGFAAAGYIAVGGVLLVVRRAHHAVLKWLVVVVANVTVAAGLLSMSTPVATVRLRDERPGCLLEKVEVCGPSAYLNAEAQISEYLKLIDRTEPGLLEDRWPGGRVDLAPIDADLTPYDIGYESSMISVDGPAVRAVVDAVSHPGSCDPGLVPSSNNLASAVIQGWLGRRLDDVEAWASPVAPDGSYPSDLVTALEALPAEQQREQVDGYLRAIATCGDVDLSEIDPSGAYAD